MTEEIYPVIALFITAALAFVIAFGFTPLWTNILYKYLKEGKQIRSEGKTPIFTKMHKGKEGTPTMGGVIIWSAVVVLILLMWLLAKVTNIEIFDRLNFLTRGQTWLPLFALITAALVGLVDDYMGVKRIGPEGGGLRMRYRLVIYLGIASLGAWWFFAKLGWDILHVPGIGDFSIGWLYIPLFIIVLVATSFSVNETDGLDGLAGGTLLTSFAAYGVLAFAHGQQELAMFCMAIAGALLAFLWFNINPARFFMGDTGAMALGITLGVVAMLTNAVLVLPIIGFVLVVESASVIIQVTSKKLRKGKKVFLSAPIHHHFEAKGWGEPKIVMRFWIISAVAAVVGLAIGLIGSGA